MMEKSEIGKMNGCIGRNDKVNSLYFYFWLEK